MHGLTVRQQDNAKISAVHFIDPSPTPHPAISLDVLPFGGGDNAQNPFVLDYRTIGTKANRLKVPRSFHGLRLILALKERKPSITRLGEARSGRLEARGRNAAQSLPSPAAGEGVPAQAGTDEGF
jgi:hypothetical protein